MSTNNLSLAEELGRFPLFIGRHIRIIKYWLNLHNIKNVNCILRTLNLTQRDEALKNPNISNWSSKVKNLLEIGGFPVVWQQGMHLSSSLNIYRELKQSFTPSPYLLIMRNKNFRNAIANLRLSSHHLNIELGRHRTSGKKMYLV